MGTERHFVQLVIFVVLILLLLGGGLLVGRHFDQAWIADRNPVSSPEPGAEPSVFRNWLWERRGLDLLVQLALVFAGTLGVAAILPNVSEGTGLSDPPTEG
jgi:hypothetical protein